MLSKYTSQEEKYLFTFESFVIFFRRVFFSVCDITLRPSFYEGLNGWWYQEFQPREPSRMRNRQQDPSPTPKICWRANKLSTNTLLILPDAIAAWSSRRPANKMPRTSSKALSWICSFLVHCFYDWATSMLWLCLMMICPQDSLANPCLNHLSLFFKEILHDFFFRCLNIHLKLCFFSAADCGAKFCNPSSIKFTPFLILS